MGEKGREVPMGIFFSWNSINELIPFYVKHITVEYLISVQAVREEEQHKLIALTSNLFQLFNARTVNKSFANLACIISLQIAEREN